MEAVGDVINQLRALSREAGIPVQSEAVHYAVVPAGSQVVNLKEYQYPHGLPPERIVAHPKFDSAMSFCSYVNSFKDERTRIFGTQTAFSFTAMLDYHPAGAGESRKPEFVSHRATFTMKTSEQWNIWMRFHDKLVPQVDFAEFLEDNRADIIQPDGATLVEIAEDLQAASEVNFASKVNRVNGGAVLSFTENKERDDSDSGNLQDLHPRVLRRGPDRYHGPAPLPHQSGEAELPVQTGPPGRDSGEGVCRGAGRHCGRHHHGSLAGRALISGALCV
jgi:Uncharacterized conserved protein (DUF2303)